MQYTLSCALYCDARCVSDTSTYGLNDTKFGGRCVGNSKSPDLSRGMHGFTCFNMGISPGCSDQYLNFYDCQWIDITGLPDGYYWLTVSSIVSIVCSIVSSPRPRPPPTCPTYYSVDSYRWPPTGTRKGARRPHPRTTTATTKPTCQSGSKGTT